MKKIIIIITVLFAVTSFVKAQDIEKNESGTENTVNSEEAEPVIENEENTEEIEKEEPSNEIEAQSEEMQKNVTIEEKAAEASKEVIEKKEDTKTQSKQGKEGYIADLSGNDENKIIAAAEWLGDKEEKSAVPQLVNLLKTDKRVKVRLYATIALGQIADESSIPALNEALTGDGNADVRYAVLLAIHRINPAKSLDALEKAKETESDPYIKDYIDKMEAKWKEK